MDMDRRNWISSTALLGSTLLFQPAKALSHSITDLDQDQDSIKLSSNENPFGPSKKAMEAIEEYIVQGNRYPNELRQQLINQLALRFGVDNQSILLGAGSSDLLQLLSFWCIHEKKTVITSKVTFDVLPKCVERFGGEVIATDLTNDKGFDLDAIEESSNKKTGVVYLVNPNNPTGSKLSYNDLLAFCDRVSRHSYIIVDEAYIEYIADNESVIQLVESNSRIIVLRTFSKIYGLAGMRVGYLIAAAGFIQTLRKYQVWSGSNLNTLGLAAAKASLEDDTFLATVRNLNSESRDFTLGELRGLGLYCAEPYGNFIWFNCGEIGVLPLRNTYAQNNLIVGASEVAGSTWMRVTIGKKETMQRFIEVAKSIWT